MEYVVEEEAIEDVGVAQVEVVVEVEVGTEVVVGVVEEEDEEVIEEMEVGLIIL
jgi:uncharacterized protein YciU (UPF0263 family)